MAIKRVVPDVATDRLEESRDFYVDVLGFDVGMDMDWIVTLVSPDNPTAQLTLMRRDPGSDRTPNVTVEVDDVDAIHREALRRGAEIVHPLTDEAWGVRRFFVLAPDGAVVNVMSHRG